MFLKKGSHVTFFCFPLFQHRGINYPPGGLLWQSADNQMVQTVRLEACGASYQTKRTQNIFMLSLFPPSASREGNVWHASLRTAFAFLSFTQRKKCYMLPLLPGSDIQHSIFHLFSQENIPFILAIPMRLTISKI